MINLHAQRRLVNPLFRLFDEPQSTAEGARMSSVTGVTKLNLYK
jgi:hypothetical protein